MEERRKITNYGRTVSLLTVTVAWAIFLTLIGSPEAILFTVPVFLLAAPLALGRYVGEAAIEAIRSRPRPRVAQSPALCLSDLAAVPVELLLAGARPGRGPPAFTL